MNTNQHKIVSETQKKESVCLAVRETSISFDKFGDLNYEYIYSKI